jgi:predicted nucleic acid-binding protein
VARADRAARSAHLGRLGPEPSAFIILGEEERVTSVYLDACCLNRPFDDQTQTRIRLESEAVLLILSNVEAGRLRLIASEALHFEIAQTPDPERRKRVTLLANAADSVVSVDGPEEKRAVELEALGFRPYDALHIACAESADVGVFLTTDDKLLRLASRLASEIHILIENPLTWLTERGYV